MRPFKVSILAVTTIVATLTLTACGSSGSPVAAQTAAPSSAAPTSAVPADTSASAQPPPPPAPTENAQQAAMTAWCNGAGYSDYQTVESDISQIGTDSGNNDLAALESDGSQLLTDAQPTVHNLPPLSKTHTFDYGLYMGWLLVAGGKLSQGDVSAAETDFQTAVGYFNKVSDLISTGCGR